MTHESIWDAIDKFADENNMSCSALAKTSGLDATTFNKSKRLSSLGKPRWPSTNSLSKILISTGREISDFSKFLHKNKTNSDMEN